MKLQGDVWRWQEEATGKDDQGRVVLGSILDSFSVMSPF